jgi:hypothetical protein
MDLSDVTVGNKYHFRERFASEEGDARDDLNGWRDFDPKKGWAIAKAVECANLRPRFEYYALD